MTEQNKWLTTKQLAERTGIAEATLRDYRYKKKGPVFVRYKGQVRYKLEDVQSWEREQGIDEIVKDVAHGNA